MKLLLLKSLAVVLNKLPKTTWQPIPLCEVYNDAGLPRPNLVGHAFAPAPTTQAVDTITETTATGHGSETQDTKELTTYGVCYVSGSGGTPTTSDSLGTTHDANYGGASAWSSDSNMTGLSASTTYSVRAYGTNSAGTGYGAVVEFTTAAAGGTTGQVKIKSSGTFGAKPVKYKSGGTFSTGAVKYKSGGTFTETN